MRLSTDASYSCSNVTTYAGSASYEIKKILYAVFFFGGGRGGNFSYHTANISYTVPGMFTVQHKLTLLFKENVKLILLDHVSSVELNSAEKQQHSS